MLDMRQHYGGASMRPEDFSPGNIAEVSALDVRDLASMRPEDFSPGNRF